MTTKEAIDKIFARLCEEHKKPGSDGWVHRDKIIEELGIPVEVFSEAYQQMRGNHDLYIEIRPDRMMKLGVSGRGACDEGRSPFR